MALVPCPECQNEVSTQALACPQCAFPFPGKQPSPADQLGTKLHTCPDCGCSVSKQAQTCPHCGMNLMIEQVHQTTNANSMEDNGVCTHCGNPYTRKVPKEEELVPDKQALPITPETSSLATPLSAGNHQEAAPSRAVSSGFLDLPSRQSNGRDFPASLRQPSPLWQDASLPQEMDRYVASSRYPRGRKKSVILGLIIFVFVAFTIALGFYWQLQGINPLKALI